ncbi:MAG TPA: penicillin acylase family protein [Alphaproteobacteria bacterium]|nr:penicillin acylase family protein [Alphaproteobacteria bacterium]
MTKARRLHRWLFRPLLILGLSLAAIIGGAWLRLRSSLPETEGAILDRVPLIGRFLDLHLPADGGDFTVNRGAFDIGNEAQPFADVHGAGFRAIYDLADLRHSRFKIAAGQSGNPLSPHFTDLARRWRDFGWLQLDKSRDELKHEGASALKLAPR